MKRYVWTHESLPANCIVEEADLDTYIKLQDLQFLSDDELFCSRYDCREIEEG